jgi:hypothetical protein
VHGAQEGRERHLLVDIGEAQYEGFSLLIASRFELLQPMSA